MRRPGRTTVARELAGSLLVALALTAVLAGLLLAYLDTVHAETCRRGDVLSYTDLLGDLRHCEGAWREWEGPR